MYNSISEMMVVSGKPNLCSSLVCPDGTGYFGGPLDGGMTDVD